MNAAPLAISLLLVDDHAVVREGYAALLAKQQGLTVIAEAASAGQAYNYFKRYHPDVVVMDISLPGASGLMAIARIKRYDCGAKIVVFSMHQQPEMALQALRAGALGYITKNSEPALLINAIYEIYRGKRLLSPDIAQTLALTRTGYYQQLIDSLSNKEFEIWRMLTEGHSKSEIAEQLGISRKTVDNSHYQIKHKLNTDSDIGLVRLAIQMKIIDMASLN